MTSHAHRIILLGADSMLGGAVLERLAEKRLDPGRLVAVGLSSVDPEQSLEYGSQEIDLIALEGTAFDSNDLVVAVSMAPALATLKQAALKAGARWIDAVSPVSAEDTLLRDEIPADVSSLKLPPPVALVVATALAALELESLHVVAGLSAAVLGRTAIDELAGQSTALLNFRQLPKGVFGQQLTFNLLPTFDTDPTAAGAMEQSAHAALTHLLNLAPPAVQLSLFQAPVFHGMTIFVHGHLKEALAEHELRNRLANAPLLRWHEAEEGERGPTAVTDGLGEEQITIGALRLDPTDSSRFRLVLVADELRAGSGIVLADALLRFDTTKS